MTLSARLSDRTATLPALAAGTARWRALSDPEPDATLATYRHLPGPTILSTWQIAKFPQIYLLVVRTKSKRVYINKGIRAICQVGQIEEQVGPRNASVGAGNRQAEIATHVGELSALYLADGKSLY